MTHWPEDEELGSGPLTSEERKALRQLLLDESRARWLWKSIRIWAAWIGAALVFIVTIQDWLIAFFKRMLGH